MTKQRVKETDCLEHWSKNIIKVYKKKCGILNGGHKPIVTCWWNDELKEANEEKRLQ